MLVQYYKDRLIIVGITWGHYKCKYIYELTLKESDFLYSQFEDYEFIKQWCIQRAEDFINVEDFQLEVREKTKLFDNEDSWSIGASEDD